MLSERERRLLSGIEHQLADSAPRLDRRMRVYAWSSTPRQRIPRLPLTTLIFGVTGLVAPTFISSIPIVFLVSLGSVALILCALLHLPVDPDPRFRSHEDGERDEY
jgi:Protein of unknown function (DUF3040)